MKKFISLGLVIVALISLGIFCADRMETPKDKTIGAVTTQLPNYFFKQAQLVGNILKSYLEAYHYNKANIDDKVSLRAFDKYIERLDYSKLYFYKADINYLKKYQKELDDQMVSGTLALVEESRKKFLERVAEAEAFRAEVFKNGINFDRKETLELDAKKLDFVKDQKEWKERWEKNYQYLVISRYLSTKEEQDNPELFKDIKKPRYKKAEKLVKKSDAELKEDAISSISKRFQKMFQRLREEKDDDYSERFFNSILGVYDPHTAYMPPRKKEDFDLDISGSLEGIGAILSEEDGFVKVMEIVPGGPAWKQKELAAGDIIMSVFEKGKEPVDLVDMRVDDAVRYIRGKKNTQINLNVKKTDNTRKTITITRDVVKIQESFAKSSILTLKPLGERVGYIQLPKFYRDFGGKGRNCSDDVRTEIRKLNKEKISALILDLRNNGGGALEDARIMGGFFIEKGPIVQVRDHRESIEILEDTDSSVEYNGPLIVLVNQYSASASEIVAAALQDYGRALIVGGPFTHGKGTVQAVLPLNQGPLMNLFANGLGALKITTQKFYRVTGASTQYKGVTPDLVIPDPYSYLKNREQDAEYSLPWDEIKGLQYTKVPLKFNLPLLRQHSADRLKNSNRFKKLSESVTYLKNKQDETVVKISMEEMILEEKAHLKKIEEYKLNDENKEIIVSNYADVINPDKISKKKAGKDIEAKEREEEWIKSFRKDPQIEESLYIIHDLLSGAVTGSVK